MPYKNREDRLAHDRQRWHLIRQDPLKLKEWNEAHKRHCEDWRRRNGAQPLVRRPPKAPKPLYDPLDLIAMQDPSIREGRHL